jgi:4'-phosphopantetheinyl transferase
MPSASSTDVRRGVAAMSRIVFTSESPRIAATRLDADSIHLWRIAYAASDRRAPLLRLLAAYLDVPASTLRLREGDHGKPSLQAPFAQGSTLQFNWSHSGNYALIALAHGVALGVDIEHIGKPARALDVARRFFAPGESTALAAVDASARKPAFTGLWCAKEAVLKAAGTGLSFGLERVVFEHLSGADWELADIDPALGAPAAWHVPGFAAAPGYRGALAWRGAARSVLAFEPTATGIATP